MSPGGLPFLPEKKAQIRVLWHWRTVLVLETTSTVVSASALFGFWCSFSVLSGMC